jgi:hypothetical protein
MFGHFVVIVFLMECSSTMLSELSDTGVLAPKEIAIKN